MSKEGQSFNNKRKRSRDHVKRLEVENWFVIVQINGLSPQMCWPLVLLWSVIRIINI